jgi:hypothetical protein
MLPHSLVDEHQRFGGICSFQPQGRRWTRMKVALDNSEDIMYTSEFNEENT